MKTFLKLCSLALGLGLCHAAMAQAGGTWPTKPIRMIVGYPAGSSPDVQARLLTEPLSKALGQPVVVENKPGAGGNIGADLIAKADDGHTIGIVGNGPLTSSKYLYPKLPYDPIKDLAPVALVGSAPLVWTVAKPAQGTVTASRYIEQARREGDRLAYGSIGAGSGGHLGMELLKLRLGIKPLHVPFNGGPAILNAIVGQQVQMTLLPASTVMPLVQAGKLDAIAVTSAQRSPLAPTLPAMEELGAKGVNIEVWNAVMAPAKMQPAHLARLRTELEKIIGARDMRQKLLAQGWRVDDVSAKALAQRIQQDSAVYADVIARNNIRLD
ncbi:MAG TPA: tripartite tricarboxylate transporter substrate binding protein [Ramlibacter sp.]|nr:tripartite tricarboxylate transporter substrate binding protein [Ramlibacter sp.]